MDEGNSQSVLISKKRKANFSTPLPVTKPKLTNKGFSISYEELGALCFATKHFPEGIPKRWDLISSLVCDYSSTLKGKGTSKFY